MINEMKSVGEGVHEAELVLATHGLRGQGRRGLGFLPLVAFAELGRPGLHHKFKFLVGREVTTGVLVARPALSLLVSAGRALPIPQYPGLRTLGIAVGA